MRIGTLTFVLAAPLLACRTDKVSAPGGPLAGVYVLRSVNDVPVPARGDGASMLPFILVADTIVVGADGFAEERRVTQAVSAAAREYNAFSLNAWEKADSRFELEYPCPDFVSGSMVACIAPPHHVGVRTATGLVIDASKMYRVPLVYERVADRLP